MRRPLTIVVAACALVLSGIGMASAVEFARRDPEIPARDYTCRLAGVDMPLGAHACLTTPQGQHVAECGIVLNMSTWRPSDGACQ